MQNISCTMNIPICATTKKCSRCVLVVVQLFDSLLTGCVDWQNGLPENTVFHLHVAVLQHCCDQQAALFHLWFAITPPTSGLACILQPSQQRTWSKELPVFSSSCFRSLPSERGLSSQEFSGVLTMRKKWLTACYSLFRLSVLTS